ncbi:MAG TPA: hypothetical protein VK801_14850 [Caulobacteraceae bacterium]|jgi:hypothetical protein|nr:hypothetical protein [Caulobacteraceae bacterium]
MWRFKGDDLTAGQARVEAELVAGVNLFEIADVYGPDNREPFVAARGEPLP